VSYGVLVAPAATTPRDAQVKYAGVGRKLYDSELQHLPKTMDKNEVPPGSNLNLCVSMTL
jgi:hypothetical protein